MKIHVFYICVCKGFKKKVICKVNIYIYIYIYIYREREREREREKT